MPEKCTSCIHHTEKNDMGFACHYCEIKEGDKEIFELHGCEKYVRRDLVQVIRCKDCKHRVNDNAFATGHICMKRRENGGRYCEDDDFCSYAERKDDGLD